MPLATGYYAPRTAVHVDHWQLPDANGDGEQVMVPVKDAGGESLGEDFLTDAQGRPVRKYFPPEGYVNHPSYDHSDNYVKVDANRRIVRTPLIPGVHGAPGTGGEAIVIKPGRTVISYPDGSVRYLDTEYQRYMFQLGHDVTDEPVDNTPKNVAVQAPVVNDGVPDDQLAAFRAWQAGQGR